MSFLARVRAQKQEEIVRLKAGPPPRRDPGDRLRPFGAALRRSAGVIAEVKGTSPSRPDLRSRAAPADLARWYRRSGAVALSVVTDRANFGTSLADLQAMREAVGLPVIGKDFVIDEIQVRTAWAAGADAVLLIARMLDADQLSALLAVVHDLGIESLVECHDAEDVEKSLDAGARIVGINNRDLAALTTDVRQTELLLPLVPDSMVRVSESGLERRGDVVRLAALGVDAFLVGHALLLSGDPGRKLREMNGRETEGAVRVKICGLTTPEDAVLCHQQGADLLGVIFATSPRRVTVDQARAIRAAVPEARLCGVFRDEELARVVETAACCGLDLVQLHGGETPEYCRELAGLTGLPLIKALTPGEVRHDTVKTFDGVKYVLLDQPKTAEGSARSADQAWMSVAEELGRQGAELILAGGLEPANINDLATGGRPFAVDVCRGVESAPGRKDSRLVSRFLQEVSR
ncbi:MAG: hypothetical protein AB7V45_14620 [Candidatus Krumholzibacteriia bacterium]